MKKKENNLTKKKFIYKNNTKKKFLYFKNFIEKKKEQKINLNNYLYKNKKLKKGVFLKKPKFKEILYPFFLNLKLVNAYLKKK